MVVEVPGTAVVGAHRDTHRPVVPLGQTHRQAESGRVAVGGHHQRGPELLAVLGGDTDDPSGPVVDDRRGHVAQLVQLRTGRDRVPGQQVIEVGARTDQPVRREVRELGPGQLERRGRSAVDPQTLVVQPTGPLAGVDAEPDQLPGRARGETVTAHLLPGELRLLQQRDVQPTTRQMRRGGRTGGSGAHDEDVGLDRHRPSRASAVNRDQGSALVKTFTNSANLPYDSSAGRVIGGRARSRTISLV